MKFKPGDKVRLRELRILDMQHGFMSGDVFTVKRVEKDEINRVSYNLIEEKNWSFHDYQLEKVGETMINSLEELEPGKIYVDNDGEEYEFIGISKHQQDYPIIALDMKYNSIDSFTEKQIIKYEWRPKEKPKKMTVKEVIEELGYEIEIVK